MKYLSFLIFLLPFISSCINDPIEPYAHDPNEITLKWNASYDAEKMENAITGLNWALSHVGARQLANPTISNTYLTINLQQLQFPDYGHTAMYSLHKNLQGSEEYLRNSSFDLGKYITLLVGSSPHYYEITGTPIHLKDILSQYHLQPKKGFLNNSSISPNHRTLSFSSPNGLHQLFLSTEIDSVSKQVLEFETLEISENGQPIFAIFSADSIRLDYADPAISTSGKPAKCMWCHESKINPLFSKQSNYPGYLTAKQLEDTLIFFRSHHESKQTTLPNGVDFSQNEEHVQMELQYIMYQQPSAQRLASEWNMTIAEVEALLINQLKINNTEFMFLPEGYVRIEVNKFAPISEIRTSTFVREPSSIEVNYIK